MVPRTSTRSTCTNTSLNSSIGDVEGFWTALYSAINVANTTLYWATQVTGDTMVNVRVGEAKTLRAFYYYLLAETFGGVPLVLTRSTSANTAFIRASGTGRLHADHTGPQGRLRRPAPHYIGFPAGSPKAAPSTCWPRSTSPGHTRATAAERPTLPWPGPMPTPSSIPGPTPWSPPGRICSILRSPIFRPIRS